MNYDRLIEDLLSEDMNIRKAALAGLLGLGLSTGQPDVTQAGDKPAITQQVHQEESKFSTVDPTNPSIPDNSRKWENIMIHHSATKGGDAKSFDKYHREHNKWDEIGYHFVILKDGTVQKGRTLTKHGAHTGDRETNKTNLGIVVVKGEGEQLTKEQNKSLTQLCMSLPELIPTLKSASGHHGKCPGFDTSRFNDEVKSIHDRKFNMLAKK